MKIRDIKLGQPYAYESSKYASRYEVAYVLSTKTHVSRPRRSLYRNGPLFSLRGDTAIAIDDDQKTGMMVVAFTAYYGLSDEARKVLGELTFEDVATNGFKLPAKVTEVAPLAEIKLVHSRYLVGEYDRVIAVEEAAAKRLEERKRERAQERALNTERWEKVLSSIAKLKGLHADDHGYHFCVTGEDPEKEIRLEDMEMLVSLVEMLREEKLDG